MHWETYSRLHVRCTRLEVLNFAVIATRFNLWSETEASELKKLLHL